MDIAYRTRTCTLYVGDCLDVIPRIRATVDTVVTSPPYNVRGRITTGLTRRTTARVQQINSTFYADSMPQQVYACWLQYVVATLLDRAKGLVWVNHKLRWVDRADYHPARMLPFRIHSEIIWHREGSLAFNMRRFAQNHEVLIGFGFPHYWDSQVDRMLSVWSITHGKKPGCAIHPCSFPLELARRPIVASCPPDGVVLDPFAGSCTVGVAALATGRRFIGIEKNPAYVPAAIDRLKAWRSEVHDSPPLQKNGITTVAPERSTAG